jgi:hypothetical protein
MTTDESAGGVGVQASAPIAVLKLPVVLAPKALFGNAVFSQPADSRVSSSCVWRLCAPVSGCSRTTYGQAEPQNLIQVHGPS